jgi:hypothetical protein
VSSFEFGVLVSIGGTLVMLFLAVKGFHKDPDIWSRVLTIVAVTLLWSIIVLPAGWLTWVMDNHVPPTNHLQPPTYWYRMR